MPSVACHDRTMSLLHQMPCSFSTLQGMQMEQARQISACSTWRSVCLEGSLPWTAIWHAISISWVAEDCIGSCDQAQHSSAMCCNVACSKITAVRSRCRIIISRSPVSAKYITRFCVSQAMPFGRPMESLCMIGCSCPPGARLYMRPGLPSRHALCILHSQFQLGGSDVLIEATDGRERGLRLLDIRMRDAHDMASVPASNQRATG
jgi:hypothetical protein